MKLTLTDIKKVKFEETIKTWIMGQMFLPEMQQDTYHRMTYGARAELRKRISTFSEATRQLILRSSLTEMIRMVVGLDNEKDIKYLAEQGKYLSYLTGASDENIKKVMPLLLEKQDTFDSHLATRIVAVTSDFYELYQKCKDTHKEVLMAMMDNVNCPVDLFVTLVNNVRKDDKLQLGYDVRARLAALITTNKIYVVKMEDTHA